MILFDMFKKKSAPADDRVREMQRCELLRHYEILCDCEDMVNNSPNFSTVVSRYNLLLDELAYFAAFDVYGDDYLQQFGITFTTSATSLWKSARDSMAVSLNNAADRLLDLEIDDALALKTKSGQENRMTAWVDKMQSVDAVPVETLKYIGALPVLDALREPKVLVTCRCGNQFRARPHAYQNYLVICPKCCKRLRVNTSNKPK